ncbi:MAG: response regulator [bacterium]
MVEDERSLLKALQYKFEAEGFEVYTAPNGQKGLESALKHKSKVILLDVIMPVMDGISMLKKLRENIWGREAKVIMLTNLSDWSSNKKATEAEVCEFLVKSDWKIQDVVDKANKTLGLK